MKKLCRVLNCKVDDIVEFIPDDQAKKVTPLVTQLSWT
jgi:DNA-binding Xre family transcriptional regulator